MKKSLSFILAMLLVVSAFFALPFSSNAATLTEKESNDTLSDANLITLGDTLNGSFGSLDNDCYKFISNEAGKINITFKILNPKESKNYGSFYLSLHGPEGEEIGMVSVDVGETANVVLPFIGAKAGTYYYLQIYEGSVYCENRNYQIKTSFTKGKYEAEVNNTENTSGKYVLANDYKGTISGDSLNGDSWGECDRDYFVMTAPADGTMTVTFTHKKRTGLYNWSGWYVDFYKHHNGGNLSLSKGAVYLTDANSKKLYSSSTVKKGDAFYLSIQSTQDYDLVGGYSYSPSDIVGEPYTISSTFVLAAKPKLTAKTTKNSVTLTSKKLKDITGYEIQIKDGKKYKKLKTIKGKTLKYTKSGLKKNKKYTFRVRAYLKKDSTTYYGKWVTVTAKTKKK